MVGGRDREQITINDDVDGKFSFLPLHLVSWPTIEFNI